MNVRNQYTAVQQAKLLLNHCRSSSPNTDRLSFTFTYYMFIDSQTHIGPYIVRLFPREINCIALNGKSQPVYYMGDSQTIPTIGLL